MKLAVQTTRGSFVLRAASSVRSCLLVLDFDDLPDLATRKAQIANDPHTLLCFVSPSGTGLKLIVRIEADASTHAESFNHAKSYFAKHYQLETDPSGKDLARLCFFSHDPELVFREDAELLHRPYMTIQARSV
ncbi:MAG: BT4734/BF3469 family protein [Kiritimatiellia bacterium]